MLRAKRFDVLDLVLCEDVLLPVLQEPVAVELVHLELLPLLTHRVDIQEDIGTVEVSSLCTTQTTARPG